MKNTMSLLVCAAFLSPAALCAQSDADKAPEAAPAAKVSASDLPAETTMPDNTLPKEPVQKDSPAQDAAEARPAPKKAAVKAETAPAPARPSAASDTLPLNIKFMKSYAEKADKETSAAIAADCSYAMRLCSGKDCPEILFIRAQMQARAGDDRGALVSLMRGIYEYPEAPITLEARGELKTRIDKMSRKLRPVLEGISGAVSGKDAEDRLVVFLSTMTKMAGDEFFSSLRDEYMDWLARFPSSQNADEVQLRLGDLYSFHEDFQSAVMEYEKVGEVYPSSQLRPLAMLRKADVLAVNIRDARKAVAAYQDLVKAYDSAPEADKAYERLALLAEEEKMYQLAVDVYSKLAVRRAGTQQACGYLSEKARVLRERMKEPEKAIAVLDEVASACKGEKAIAAYQLASRIAAKDMKDSARQTAYLKKIADEYATSPAAPQALYEAGRVCEDRKDLDGALEFYRKVAGAYSGDSNAVASQKRIDAINKKKASK